MPHKRAKRTLREEVKKERGSDLAPTKDSLRNEAIPKSASRILNAHSIREDWKLKRKHGDGEDVPKQKRRKTEGEKKSLKIQPGESMQHFNRRVEDDLRPLVKSATQAARVVSRGAARSEAEARSGTKKGKATHKSTEQAVKSPSPPPVDKHANRPKEFAVAASSAPRRLNDIAQAPPELKQLPRGAAAATSKKDSILSLSQKLMMEGERVKAIARYRELKASRKRTADQDEGV